MYHRISVLVPVLVRVPEYLSTSTITSTSIITLELTSTSTVRVPEIQYLSTASMSTSTEYEYPSPGHDRIQSGYISSNSNSPNGSTWKYLKSHTNYMTLPFDHTHDLDLRVERSESEIALSQEWDGWLTWNEKDVSHPFRIDLCDPAGVNTDVPDSDWGDFRLRRAIDISSSATTLQ